MLRRVVLVRANVSEELSASFITVTRIGELGTTLAVISNRHTLERNAKYTKLPNHVAAHYPRNKSVFYMHVICCICCRSETDCDCVLRPGH
jgi:hypothetical protein